VTINKHESHICMSDMFRHFLCVLVMCGPVLYKNVCDKNIFVFSQIFLKTSVLRDGDHSVGERSLHSTLGPESFVSNEF